MNQYRKVKMREIKPILNRLFYILAIGCIMSVATEMSSSAFSAEFYESFDACEIPPGWTVEDLGGDCNWIFDSTDVNKTGGGDNCFSFADSDGCGTGTSMNTALITPVIDCSNVSGSTLSFKHDARVESETTSTSFTVEISTNGTDWLEIWQEAQSKRGPQTETIDISVEADGQPSVRIRFRYVAAWDWWWQVDDVTISSSGQDKFPWLLFYPALVGR